MKTLRSAAPARAHIKSLSHVGIGKRVIADATDVSASTIRAIRRGVRTRIHGATEAKILQVNTDCRADHSCVPSTRAWTLIGQLLEEGFTRSRVAFELGRCGRAIQLGHARITVRNEARIVALHLRLTT